MVLLTQTVAAQITSLNGIQPFSTQASGSVASIDLATTNILIRIPIRNKTGKIPFSYFLEASSSPSGGGVGFGGITTTGGHLISTRVYSAPCQGGQENEYKYFYYIDTTGAAHFFPISQIWTGPGTCGSGAVTATSADGTGYTLVAFGGTTLSFTVYDKSGNYISSSTPSNVITDPDGATINLTYPNGTFTYTDSLGQVAIVQTYNGGPSSDTYVYTDGSGNDQTFTVGYTSMQLVGIVGCTGGSTQAYFPTSVSTPAGNYTLSYEQPSGCGSGYTDGRIVRIGLPAGGYEAFGYFGGANGYNTTSLIVPTLTHTLSDSNGSVSTWTYVNNNNTAPNQGQPQGNYTVTETDAAGNQTLHYFAGEFQTQTAYYQGTSTVLKTFTTCYGSNGAAPPVPPNCVSPSTVPTLPITETDVYTSLNSSSTNRVKTTFDSYGNATSVIAYDFGATTPTTQNFISYGQSWNGSACTAYPAGTYIYNTPCYTHIANGSGTDLAKTKISYNNDGKPASVSRWTGAVENTWLTTSFGYGANGAAAGVLSSITEPNGAVTTLNSFTCNGILPTGTTYPLSSVGSDSQTWDCNGGVKTSYTDVNNNKTTYKYNDPLWRLTEVDNPDGGATTTTYNTGTSTPWTVSTCSTITPSSSCPAGTNSLTGLAKLDGLGRTIERQTTSDPGGTDYMDTTYDVLGRVASVTNPYRSTGDATYGVTSYQYDALGRATTITNPDSSTKQMLYFQGWQNVQDEGNGNGSHRVTRLYQHDGLGRLITVCEVTSATQLGGGSPVSCSTNGVWGANGFVTSYTYDALGNMLGVAQGGQTRTFNYDGLSRLTLDANPEAWGGTSYTYDAAGQLGDLYRRSAPKPNLGSGNGNRVTTYNLDLMHRQTGISYDDTSTPWTTYAYDQSSNWGATLYFGKGRMTGAFTCPSGTQGPSCGSTNPSSTGTIFSYDKMGRVAWDEQCTPSTCGHSAFSLPYSYDYLGDVTSAGNGISGVTFSATYNNAGQLSGLTSSLSDSNHPGTLVQGPQYNALGQVTTDNLGFLNEHYGYTNRGWLYSYWACKVPGTGCTQANMQYTFNMQIWQGGNPIGLGYAPNGDILNSVDWINGTWSYSYDDFNRLSSSCVGSGSCPSYNYSYDQYSNRWQQNSNPSYTFDGNNHITGSQVYYDAAGNVTQDGPLTQNFHNYTYDGENRVIGVDSGSTATYVYDALGRRSSKTTGGAEVDYLYDLAGHQVAEVSSSGAWNRGEVYAGARHIATYLGGTTGSTYLDLSDWTGTERVRVNSTQSSQETCTSLLFGDGKTCTGTDENPMHYTGQQWDSESNLHHFMFRDYSTTQGRWMKMDPAGLAAVDITNPQSWNRYAYVLNNPLGAIDPLGLDCVLLNSLGTVDHIEKGDCTDPNGNGYYFDGQVPGALVTGEDPNGDVWAVVNGKLTCSGECPTGSTVYDTEVVNGGPAPSVSTNVSLLSSPTSVNTGNNGVPTATIQVDSRTLYQRFTVAFNNWVKYSPGAVATACITAPDYANYYADLHDLLHGMPIAPTDSSDGGGGGGGPAIWVNNINTQQNGGQSPYGSSSGAGRVNGYALVADWGNSAIRCGTR